MGLPAVQNLRYRPSLTIKLKSYLKLALFFNELAN